MLLRKQKEWEQQKETEILAYSPDISEKYFQLKHLPALLINVI